MKRIAFALLSGFVVSSGFAQSQSGVGKPNVAPIHESPTLQSLAEPSTKNDKTIRLQAVHDAAMVAAMRASLAKQSEYINGLLEQHGRLLDDAYDFPSLMLANNVVPPVVRKIERAVEQSGETVLKFSTAQFKIVRQATFATRAPSWRTYLPIPIWNDPAPITQALMPKNSAEQQSAEAGLAKGWRDGIEQANAMFFKGLTRLQNDWVGMSTYHALLKANMVTPPVVDRKDVAVSGTSDTMVVDQTTYRIEARPVFNPNIDQWVALLDTTGAADFLLEAAKAKSAESSRAKLSAPSLDELRKQWGVSQ